MTITTQPDSLLRHRPFVLFWLARLSVTASYQMLIVAGAWQVYGLTRGPYHLGLIGLIQVIPAMLPLLVVRPVTDRFDRRLVLVSCHILDGIAAAPLLI